MELIVLRGGEEYRVRVERRGHLFHIDLGDRDYEVDSVATNGNVRSLLVEGRQFEVAVHRRGEGRYQVSAQEGLEDVEVSDPLTFLARHTHEGKEAQGSHRIEAYMPGRVVQIEVEEGQQVEAGDGLIVLEAMKMENEILAERPGVVRRVLVTAGQAVEGGDGLFEIE